MTDHKAQLIRGHARVTFRAHIALIRTELEQGHTAKAIFERHETKLGSMSYRQFLRHIEREITGVTRASSAQPLKPDPVPPPPREPPGVTTPATSAGTSAHARYEPTRLRTFVYDGNPRQDDEERLIGKPKPRTDK